MDYRRPWGWTDADYEMLEICFRAGLGNDEIAQAMERTVSTITAALKRRGLNRGANNCLACGKVLVHPKSGRRRRYCDATCGRSYRAVGDAVAADPVAPVRDQRPCCRVCRSELTEEQVRRRLAKGLTLDFCSGTCRQQACGMVDLPR